MIKLFVCDVDNTLLHYRHGLPKANVEAIHLLQKAGITVALASGRILPGMTDLAKQLHLDRYGGYLIASNGSYVKSVKDGRVLKDDRIDLPALKSIVRMALDLGVHASVQQGDLLYYAGEDESIHYNRDIVGLNLKLGNPLDEALYEGSNKIEVTHFIHRDPVPFDQIIDALKDDYSLIRGHQAFLDVMPKGTSKATGMQSVMQDLGLEASEVAAIGDGENDRAMLKAAGLSATLSGAWASLEHEVDHVVAPVEQAGLASFAHLIIAKNAN